MSFAKLSDASGKPAPSATSAPLSGVASPSTTTSDGKTASDSKLAASSAAAASSASSSEHYGKAEKPTSPSPSSDVASAHRAGAAGNTNSSSSSNTTAKPVLPAAAFVHQPSGLGVLLGATSTPNRQQQQQQQQQQQRVCDRDRAGFSTGHHGCGSDGVEGEHPPQMMMHRTSSGGQLSPLPSPHGGPTSPLGLTSSALGPPPSLRVLVQAPSSSSSPNSSSSSSGVPSSHVVTVPYKDDLRVQDVIEFVARRHRLPVFTERWVLRVTSAEAARFGLLSRDLHPMTLLAPMALDTIELVRKVFADAPSVDARAGGGGSKGRGGGGADRYNAALQEAIENLQVGRPPGAGANYHGAGYYGGGAGYAGGGGGAHAYAAAGGGGLFSPGGNNRGGGDHRYGGGGRGYAAAGGNNSEEGMSSTTGGGGGGGGQYYSSPAATGTGGAGGSGSGGLGRSSASGPGGGDRDGRGGGNAPLGYLHNVLSASQFQEWKVIKTNKRGRRQERLLGIDINRLTNRKVEKARMFFSDATVHAERLISDIRRVEIPESDRLSFAITVRDVHHDAAGGGGGGGGDVTLHYEARTSNERDEIVAKLAYILRSSGQLHKIIRLP